MCLIPIETVNLLSCDTAERVVSNVTGYHKTIISEIMLGAHIQLLIFPNNIIIVCANSKCVHGNGHGLHAKALNCFCY